MPTDLDATKAILTVSSTVREQVRRLVKEDGCTAGDVEQMLGIPAGIVEKIVGGTAEPQVALNGEAVDELIANAQAIEKQLADAQELAVATLADVCATAESAGVRMAAAKTILEMRTGSLRQKEKNSTAGGTTIEVMNVLIQDAMRAYTNQTQTPAPKLAELSPSVLDTSIARN